MKSNVNCLYLWTKEKDFKRLIENSNQPLYKELKNLRLENIELQISPKTRTP